MLANKKVGLKLEGGVLVLWKKYVQFRKIAKIPNLKKFLQNVGKQKSWFKMATDPLPCSWYLYVLVAVYRNTEIEQSPCFYTRRLKNLCVILVQPFSPPSHLSSSLVFKFKIELSFICD
jgi:hypothetical protein